MSESFLNPQLRPVESSVLLYNNMLVNIIINTQIKYILNLINQYNYEELSIKQAHLLEPFLELRLFV
jgi:hypothetical protein